MKWYETIFGEDMWNHVITETTFWKHTKREANIRQSNQNMVCYCNLYLHTLGRNWEGTRKGPGRNWEGTGKELGRNWEGTERPKSSSTIKSNKVLNFEQSSQQCSTMLKMKITCYEARHSMNGGLKTIGYDSYLNIY